jgi:hypothetical protein
MRIFAASVIIAAVSLGMPVFVQAQGAPSLSEAQTPPAQSVSLIVAEFRAGKRAVQGHIHGMEHTIALSVVASIIVFAAVYSLLTLGKRK